MNQNLSRDEKLKLYIKGAKEFYPDISVNSAFSIYSGEQNYPTSGKIQLNHGIVDPTLFSTGTLEVVHYTSVQSFFDIINSEHIRLYNCYNLNDPKEIEHGLKTLEFPFDSDWLIDIKQNHFILSASKYDDQLRDNFNMWRLYGKEGMGIGLVFEVPQEIKYWTGINMSKIEYSSCPISNSNSKKYFDYHKDFQSKYALFEKTPSIIPLLASFHKDEIWKIENETRIVVYCPFNDFTLKPKESAFDIFNPFLSKTISHTINSNGDNVSYVKMPISQISMKKKHSIKTEIDIQDTYLKSHPYLQLKKVILGPRLVHSKQLDRVLVFIENVIKEKIGERIHILESQYKDVYKEQ
jgi:hypothetical protein